MKKCKTCGAEFTDDTPVCPICGSELEYMTSENAVNTDENAVNTDEIAAVTNFEENITNETEQPAKPKKSKAGLVIVIIILLAALGVGGFYLYKYLTKSPFEILAEKLSQLEEANSCTTNIEGKLTTDGTDVPLNGEVLIEKNDKTLNAQMNISAEIPMFSDFEVSGAWSADMEKETVKFALSALEQIQAYSIDLSENDETDGAFDKLENAKTLDEAVDAIIDIIFENADDEEHEKLNKEEYKACIKESFAYLNSKEALKEIWHYEKKDDVYSFDANTLDIFNVFVENMKPAFKDVNDYESFVADFKEAKDEYEAPFKMSFIVKNGNLTSLSISLTDKNGSELNFLFTVKDNLPTNVSVSLNDKVRNTGMSLKLTFSDFNKTKVEFSNDMLEAFENAEELKLDDIVQVGPNSADNGDDDNGDNDITDNTGTGEQTSDYELIARSACEKHLNDYGKFASEAYVAIYGYEEDWIIYKIEDDRPVLVDNEQKKQDIIDKLFGESFDTNDMWTKSEGYANSDTVYWCVIENDKTCTTAFNDIVDTYDAIFANGTELGEGTVFVWKSGSKKRIFKLSEGGGIIIIANSLEDETTADLEKVDTSDIEGASSKVKVYTVK